MKETVRIAFQGEPGAFSESAALAYEAAAETVPCATFEDVAEALAAGRADCAVLPVENSLAGGVVAAWDVLAGSAVSVIAEVVVPVRLGLLAVPGAALGQLREARSHPVALAQCRLFLRSRPWLRPVAVHDTAGAAREVAHLADTGLAAIASREAGARYGLDCLVADIQDRPDNQTRFFVLEQSPSVPASFSPDSLPAAAASQPRPPLKTALVAVTEDRPGALRDLLSAFADRGLDLAHIASRPGGSPWTYAFVIEVRHHTTAELEDALAAAGGPGRSIRVLGTFPAATAG